MYSAVLEDASPNTVRLRLCVALGRLLDFHGRRGAGESHRGRGHTHTLWDSVLGRETVKQPPKAISVDPRIASAVILHDLQVGIVTG